MKKTNLLFVALFFLGKLNAQVYHPMLDSVSNNWYFVINEMPVAPPESVPINCMYGQWSFGGSSTIYSTQGDTVLNGNTYEILMESDYFGSQICTYGYMREDTAARKIFFVDNTFNPEELIYDFSMQVGDSIDLVFYQSFGMYSSGMFTMDSITTVTIPAGTRNLYYLSNHAVPFSPPLQWIESVGYPGHIIYTKSCNMQGFLFSFICQDKIDRSFCMMLTCFEHSASKVYFDSCSHQLAFNNSCFAYEDSCNYWNICGSIEEISSIKSFYASPNPAINETVLTLKLSKGIEGFFQIKDGEGRTIFSTKKIRLVSGENKIPLSLKNIRPGIYFIELKTSEKSFYNKLVVSG